MLNPFLAWMISGSALAAAPVHCTTATTGEDLTLALNEAESAFLQLDTDRFTRGMDTLTDTLRCLGSVPARGELARTHRLQGVRRYVGGDLHGAAASFAASRRLDPDATLPDGLFPEGHEIWQLFDTVDLSRIELTHVPRPVAGTVLLDGEATAVQPYGLPTLYSWAERPSGPIWVNVYLGPLDPLPSYPVDSQTAVPVTESTARTTRRKPSHALRFGLAAGGTAALAGGLYGLAVVSRAELDEPSTSWTNRELTGVQGRTNALVVGSVLTGAAALALTGIAVGGSW